MKSAARGRCGGIGGDRTPGGGGTLGISGWGSINQLYLNTVNGSASWFSDMPCNNCNLKI